jgi:hypothetical protein|tara:strand:- start:76 stop:294 length:219 start_codon:yes stop_codon:yes gene_type:complete
VDSNSGRIVEFLRDPATDEVIQLLETEMFEEWAYSKDTKSREDLWFELKAMQRFFTRLRATADNVQLLSKRS